MLTQDQKKQLKALANKCDVRYQIGKSEITESVVAMFDKAIEARELIKIDVMKSVEAPVMEIALDLANKINAEVVQVVGRVIILFRRNKVKPKIKFTK